MYGNIMTISMHAVQQSKGSSNKNCVGMFIGLPHAFLIVIYILDLVLHGM